MINSSAIKYYFSLQLKRFSRKAADYEIPTIVLVVLILAAFILASVFLFYKSPMAKWIYPFAGAYATQYFSDKQVQSIFTTKQSFILNLVSKLLIATPFMGFLIYKMEWLSLVILFLLTIIMAFVPQGRNVNFKVPTPFRSRPFEFIIGFRRSYIFVLLAYFLIFKGIQVGNENLAFASFSFLFLLSMSYFFIPENEYFVWINSKTPHQFLMVKIKTAIINVSVLTILPSLVLLIFYTTLWYVVPIIYAVGYLYLITIILGKYAAFPNEISIPQSIIILISMICPPIMIFTLPSFYKRAIQKLNPILAC
ncbi:hypothetical protein [Portibacter lacus]|uniref:hypothetical protein n=1 Tax=Portibacter lacus TaxID=1099794 RepID=UPI001F21D8EB|nr:hypothetical protein [Portibacter lacus]